MNEETIKAKALIVDEIAEKFSKAQSAVIVEFRGLNVENTMDLRRQLRAEEVDFKVYKNSMVERAVEKAGYDELKAVLVGPNAIAFSDDAVAPSRILATYARKRTKLIIKGGIIEGKIVDVDTIKEIATLPNKEGMIAMILGCFQSPIRNFAYAIKSIADQKAEE